jgi:hypothetical protein
MAVSRAQVLVPTPPPRDEAASVTYALGRPVRGAKVGLRLDTAWRSYEFVVDEWARRLAGDGADVATIVTGERAGPHSARTRTDLDDWSRLVDCAVVGLGN